MHTLKVLPTMSFLVTERKVTKVTKADMYHLDQVQLKSPGPVMKQRDTTDLRMRRKRHNFCATPDLNAQSEPNQEETPDKYRLRGSLANNWPVLPKDTKFFKNRDWETVPERRRVNKHKNQTQPVFLGLHLQPENFFFHLL